MPNYFKDYENFKAGKVKVNLKNAKPGDRLLMKNGTIVFYKKMDVIVNPKSNSVYLHIIQYDSGMWSTRSTGGRTYLSHVSDYDIVYNFGQ